MKNTFGQAVTLTIFGESHGPAVGVVLDGLAPGLPVDEERIRLREEVSEQIRALEEKYARLECPIVSNNSAHRWTDDVPMVVPEINADHLAVSEAQRERAQRGLCLWAGAALPRGLCRLLQIPRL